VSSRALILERVRRLQPATRALPELPRFRRAAPSLAAFGRALERMGGVLAEPPSDGSLDAFIRARFPDARTVCSATPEVEGTRRLEPDTDARTLADVDLGVVRAAFGVVETGSVFLSEAELGVNALGFLAQHLVVLLDPGELVADLHGAYRDPRFLTARYAVLMTGPSATADIEGVLVRGAQGVRSLTVVPAPRPEPGATGRRLVDPSSIR
jgi:L-lactate dehydrogenase complex protein LldG